MVSGRRPVIMPSDGEKLQLTDPSRRRLQSFHHPLVHDNQLLRGIAYLIPPTSPQAGLGAGLVVMSVPAEERLSIRRVIYLT
jgi:hypothetical protein